MKSPVPIFATALIYVLVGPGIGTLVFLLDMGLPPALWQETTAVLLIIGFGYVAGFIPAVGTACLAAALGARPLWQRVLFPALIAGGGTELVMVLILRADWNDDSQHLRSALRLAGFAGALTAGGALEWWRRRVR